jgi:hypothetical protein
VWLSLGFLLAEQIDMPLQISPVRYVTQEKVVMLLFTRREKSYCGYINQFFFGAQGYCR